jgi:hypothetical protein
VAKCNTLATHNMSGSGEVTRIPKANCAVAVAACKQVVANVAYGDVQHHRTRGTRVIRTLDVPPVHFRSVVTEALHWLLRHGTIVADFELEFTMSDLLAGSDIGTVIYEKDTSRSRQNGEASWTL